uniref:E3 ubiquitin-protein ligase RNF168-like isoform X2 n=1 Tax=Myxine glutinosa TaxID=7769 RepID=UPI00358ECC96
MAQSSKEEEEECELEEENSYYSSEAMGKTTVRRAPQSHHASSLSSLRFRDCRCPICMDVLLEPVTLPCKHSFCLACFEQASQAVSLTCSMCRKRFATWARQASRRGSLVNVPLWRAVQKLMPIRCRRRIEERDNINATNGNAGATGAALSNNNNLEGDPSDTQEEEEFEETSYTPKHMCLPGEIRQEYQEQVSQFEVLRLAFEDEECQQSDHLIRKLHEEDQKEQQARDLERKRVVDQDEILANIIDMEMKLTPMKKVDKGRPETRSKRRIAKFGCDADFERPKSPRACQSKTPSFTLEDKNGNNLQISQGNQNASATYRSISASVSMLSDFTDTSQEKLAGAGSVPPRSDSTCSGDSISLELNHFKPIVEMQECKKMKTKFVARERKTNDELRKMMGIEPVIDVVKRNRLRWFGHVLRKDESDWLRRVMEMNVEGSRGRGRPRKTWLKMVEEEMRARGLTRRVAENRARWRRLSWGPQG